MLKFRPNCLQQPLLKHLPRHRILSEYFLFKLLNFVNSVSLRFIACSDCFISHFKILRSFTFCLYPIFFKFLFSSIFLFLFLSLISLSKFYFKFFLILSLFYVFLFRIVFLFLCLSNYISFLISIFNHISFLFCFISSSFRYLKVPFLT